MGVEYNLGSLIRKNDREWRVIRIVQNSRTLFEPLDGARPYVQVESYIELKAVNGDIEFITLMQEKEDYGGDACHIKGLEPINWKGELR